MPPGDFHERTDIRSWGRVVRHAQRVAQPRFRDELPALLAQAQAASRLAVGLRRSYSDSCLNSQGALIDMTALDRVMAFDSANGVLRAEAGMSLAGVLALAVPQGWFLPTTPGTRFVTLGGAVANDVHGKNHHRAGSFGRHVRALGLVSSRGERMQVGPAEQPGLFAATVGGLGLTGVIEWVEIGLSRIRSAYLDVEVIPFGGLDEFLALSSESADGFEHTIAWIDCVHGGAQQGRGVFSRANWALDGALDAGSERSWKRVPVDAPSLLLNAWTVGAFNSAYHAAARLRAGQHRQHYSAFFYPLDSIRDWNRLYGSRGMLQYQCVVPPLAISGLLATVVASGQASFLATLKAFGPLESGGLLSFPREGVTLALDFPNRGSATLALMADLDRLVLEARGALYPAKDGRMGCALFRHSFPRWAEFASACDPGLSSDFWRRVSSE